MLPLHQGDIHDLVTRPILTIMSVRAVCARCRRGSYPLWEYAHRNTAHM